MAKGAGMMEMAGLAQKGGAVHIHCRLANAPEDISAIRVATGRSACADRRRPCRFGRGQDPGPDADRSDRCAVVNSHEIITGDFTRDTEFTIPLGSAGACA